MSLPQRGFEGGRAGRRRTVVVAVVLLLALIGWGYLVVSWGGPAERTEAGADGFVERKALSPDDRREPQDVPDGNARATAPGERAPVEKPVGRDVGTHDHPHGAAHEPGSYDPLGTGASSRDLSETDRERVRFVAAEFVSAAYGYSGRDEDVYNQGVGETVVWPIFYESEGAAEVRRYAEQVGRTGTRSAAELTRFEIEEATPELAAGYAYFETGEGRDPRTGELTGERLAYRQQMTLARSGVSWKVKAAGEVEED